MKNKRSILTGVVIVAIAALLLPGMIQAGSLEPSGAPAPTMRTLDEIYSTGSWSRRLPCDVGNCPRFEVLADFNNEAVLDKETGLVWQKSPSTTQRTWVSAVNGCYNSVTVPFGWRLPRFEELFSLIVGSDGPPAGHPFENLQVGGYWSSTSIIDDPTKAKLIELTYFLTRTELKTNINYYLCVRGGNGGYFN